MTQISTLKKVHAKKLIIRASTSVDAKFLSILHKKSTFSILHTHYYKTLTSIYLFYTFIQ